MYYKQLKSKTRKYLKEFCDERLLKREDRPNDKELVTSVYVSNDTNNVVAIERSIGGKWNIFPDVVWIKLLILEDDIPNVGEWD